MIGYETGDLTGDEIALRRPQILADIVVWKERVSEIRKLLEDEEERQEAVRSTGDILGAAGDLDSLDVNEKRRLLANLRMRVIVYERENRMVLEWHGGAFLEVASGVADRVRSPRCANTWQARPCAGKWRSAAQAREGRETAHAPSGGLGSFPCSSDFRTSIPLRFALPAATSAARINASPSSRATAALTVTKATGSGFSDHRR